MPTSGIGLGSAIARKFADTHHSRALQRGARVELVADFGVRFDNLRAAGDLDGLRRLSLEMQAAGMHDRAVLAAIQRLEKQL